MLRSRRATILGEGGPCTRGWIGVAEHMSVPQYGYFIADGTRGRNDVYSQAAKTTFPPFLFVRRFIAFRHRRCFSQNHRATEVEVKRGARNRLRSISGQKVD